MQILQKIPSKAEMHRLLPEKTTLLWDMDGTLINTEPFHAMAISAYLKDVGINHDSNHLEHILELCCGKTDVQVFESLKAENIISQEMSHLEFETNKEKYFTAPLAEKEFSSKILDPKIPLLLAELAKTHPMAVVTSSDRKSADLLLKKANIFDLFDCIITVDDVEKSKPDPLPYHKAIEMLKTSSERVAIFEDSQTGLSAANQSGANWVFKVEWYHA